MNTTTITPAARVSEAYTNGMLEAMRMFLTDLGDVIPEEPAGEHETDLRARGVELLADVQRVIAMRAQERQDELRAIHPPRPSSQRSEVRDVVIEGMRIAFALEAVGGGVHTLMLWSPVGTPQALVFGPPWADAIPRSRLHPWGLTTSADERYDIEMLAMGCRRGGAPT